MPARISVTGEDGRGWAPDDAWRHADDGFDRKVRPFEMTYFHAAGSATLTLPAGRYSVLATRGLEYAPVTLPATVVSGVEATAGVRLERLIDLPASGWWNGDLHVHMNYGGTYRADPTTLRAQAEAEDLHVVENLIVNKEQRIPDVAMFRAELDPVSTPTTLLKHDEEYHTSWWGHTGHLGLTKNLILPNYAGYVNTAAASLFPDNATISDLARAQDGLSGYVHPFDPPAPDPGGPDPLTMALPIDVALGKVDYLEVVGFSDHRVTADVWYRLLNCGFRIPAGAGTDAMTNYASLRGPVGMNRVFVRSGARLDYRGWLAALKAGRTFASNGPLLSFSLEGKEPGEEIALPKRPKRLTAKVSLRSIVPIEKLEIVSNGAVVATIPTRDGGLRADAEVPLRATGSSWYTLRAWSPTAREPVLDIYPFATTSPIYVTVAGTARSKRRRRPVLSPVDRASRGRGLSARGLERRARKVRGPRTARAGEGRLRPASAGGGALEERRSGARLGTVQPKKERLGEKHGHLAARDRVVRTVVVSAAAAGDLFFRELLDPSRKLARARHVVEIAGGAGRRQVPGPVRGLQQEHGHLCAGDRSIRAVVAVAAASRDQEAGERLDPRGERMRRRHVGETRYPSPAERADRSRACPSGERPPSARASPNSPGSSSRARTLRSLRCGRGPR